MTVVFSQVMAAVNARQDHLRYLAGIYDMQKRLFARAIF
jgi:hypothetical protein